MLGDFSPEAYALLREEYASKTETTYENEFFEHPLTGELHTETSGLRAKYMDRIESEINEIMEQELED